MFGFAEIAAMSPSDVSGMTKHLMHSTLGRESALAAYYSKGGDGQSRWFDLAEQVLAGEIDRDEAIHALMVRFMRGWNPDDTNAMDQGRAAFEDRFDGVLERTGNGLAHAPLAVVRPDTVAGVMIGLCITPGILLTEQEVNNLLAGRRVDGEKIEGKHYAVERSLPEDRRDGRRKWSTPIGSYDFCFTPDKSVSVVWAFADDVGRAKIYNAVLEANREGASYIANTIAVARYGKGGQGGREAGGVAIIEFTHHTSRRVQFVTGEGLTAEVVDGGIPGDMNLHIHNLIPNAVFTPSGKVGSLDTMGVHGIIKEAGGVSQARLATKLRESGFDVVLDEKTGAARMTVVPDEIRTLFSKKTALGEEMARRQVADEGKDWNALSEAERTTRLKEATQRWEVKQKGGRGAKDDVADFENWRQQAAAAGWAIPKTLELIGPPLRDLTIDERHRAAYEIGLPWLDQQLQRNAVMTHHEVRRAALRGLVHTGMSDLADVNAITQIMRAEGVLQNGERTELLWDQEEGKRHVSISTGLHEREEREFISLAKAAAMDRSGAIEPALLSRKIDESGLDFTDAHGQAQRTAIERIGSGGRLGIIIASAGAGKTASLRPLVASWSEMQRDVWGSSLASRQTDDLVGAGIDRRRLWATSVLNDKLSTDEITLTRNSVVMVDELGLLSTRQGLDLLRHRDQIGFSIVALGDPKQCQAVAAGNIIDLTRRALGAENVPTILTTRRQRSAREKEIAGLFRDGEAATALSMKRSDGSAIMAYGGRDGTIDDVAKRYIERLTETGSAPMIVAPTNTDAHQIGSAVRRERRKLGLIGDRNLISVPATDGSRDYNLALAKGDRVRLFKSTGADYGNKKGGSIGRNGSVLEVIDANAQGAVLKSEKTGRVGKVAWDGLRPDGGGRVQLAYGDCMTIHSAQGADRNGVILAMPAGSQAITGHEGYSAATRHKEWFDIITNEAAERSAVRQSRPLNDAHDITPDDKWAHVAKRFALQQERDTATALRERAGQIKRGAVKAFHTAITVADPRLRPKSEKQAPEVVQARKIDLSPYARQAMDAVRDLAQRVSLQISRVQARPKTPSRGPSLER
jgi:hypothetical protein